MPGYTTHGQLKWAWQRQVDAAIEDTQDARESAMGDIDDALAGVISGHFHPWLRVISKSGEDLTLSLEDGGFLTVGDTIGIYDNTNQKRLETTTTVSGVSGSTVTVASATDINNNDEIAVLWSFTAGSRTVNQIGPPREIAMCSRALARYYAMADIAGLDDPGSTVADAYDRATEWLKERGRGIGVIQGASYRDQVYSTTIDEQPAIDIDGIGDYDDQALDRVKNARI